jgi:hypothetical protein
MSDTKTAEGVALKVYEIEYEDAVGIISYLYADTSFENAVRRYARDCFERGELAHYGECEDIRVFEFAMPTSPGPMTESKPRRFIITAGLDEDDMLSADALKVEEVKS